jgi:peptidoglycan/LPS O-acetylase OafA/YrhL
LGTTSGIIANLSIAIIMFYSVFGPKGLWFKFLNLRLLNFIGILSYSIYLWQQFFICKSSNWFTQFPQNIFILFAFAFSSHYIIENPFMKLKTRFSVSG